MTKYKKGFWVESLPKVQNTANLPTFDSTFNENHAYRGTGHEVLPEVNTF